MIICQSTKDYKTTDPGSTAIYADTFWYDSIYWQPGGSPNHRNGYNVGYIDGHCSWYTDPRLKLIHIPTTNISHPSTEAVWSKFEE